MFCRQMPFLLRFIFDLLKRSICLLRTLNCLKVYFVNQARRKIAEIWCLVSSVVGPKVLMKAQMRDKPRISSN